MLAGISLVAVAVRLPFISAGVGADEGGYAFIAHEWARGAHLYQTVYVDRPQGFLLLYRAITDIAYQPWAIRTAALIAGVVLTLLMGVLGWMLRSPATGMAAAAIFAVAGVAPHIEGFTLNGELAAAVPATGAVACAVRWRLSSGERWLAAAGFLGAVAILMKQSGFDGLITAAVFAFVAAAPLAARLRRTAVVLGSAAVPLGGAALHGLTLGWHNYWLAMYGWRAQEDLGRSLSARVQLVMDHLPRVAPDLWAPSLVAAIGLIVCFWRRGPLWVAPVWLVTAFAGVNLGGWYHIHYFVQLLPPLALLAAIGATAARGRFRASAIGLSCLAVAPVVLTFISLAAMSRSGSTIRSRGSITTPSIARLRPTFALTRRDKTGS